MSNYRLVKKGEKPEDDVFHWALDGGYYTRKELDASEATLSHVSIEELNRMGKVAEACLGACLKEKRRKP